MVMRTRQWSARLFLSCLVILTVMKRPKVTLVSHLSVMTVPGWDRTFVS